MSKFSATQLNEFTLNAAEQPVESNGKLAISIQTSYLKTSP
jgi:hypothetical protein